MSVARLRMMVDKLYAEVQSGRIENYWVENFICDMRERLKAGMGLTDKQITKLEELFEQY